MANSPTAPAPRCPRCGYFFPEDEARQGSVVPARLVRAGVVVVRDLAEFLEHDPSVIHKAIKAMGIRTDTRRDPGRRGSYVNVMTLAEAERFLTWRRSRSLAPAS